MGSKQTSTRPPRIDRARSDLRVWGVYANGGAVDFVVGEEKAHRRAVEVARTLGGDVQLVEFAPVGDALTMRRSA